MITEAIVTVLVGLVNGVALLFPDATVPGWFTAAGDQLGEVLVYVSSVSAWVPTTLMMSVLVAVLLSVVIGFGIRLVRILLSFLTAGGGAAG